ncbi:MATE family efflux transporter [Paraburkholderia sp. C35]|uniref:MATE family efflux transporter n=1 Tax=Paraburkholderia sp. C35 TaxID=2126993 RepID=UPI000D68D9E8|nr:MATE family efflux transporter [Paraburkholderia sp. C35]
MTPFQTPTSERLTTVTTHSPVHSDKAIRSTNRLLHGPILSTLVRLALPTVAVLLMTTVLGIAETYFVSTLGADAIAAASMVVPVMLTMTMVANGGIGGGVSSAIARARGAGRYDEAESIAWHAVVIATVAGALFSFTAIAIGPAIYRYLGGVEQSLRQAILYSNILFAGAIPYWMLALLQSALRGSGNVKTPALMILGSVVAGLILSPALISGKFGLPALGVAGAGIAQVICNVGALAAEIAYMRSKRATLQLRRYPLNRAHFRAILAVGFPSTTNALMTTFSISAVTAAAGAFGVSAIAGYGIASRLDMLLIPVMFGFGTAALVMVGTSLGAGNVARARRAALLNAIFVAIMLEGLGLLMAFVPRLWINLFTQDPAIVEVGANYFRMVGPVYGLIAVISELYFAGQGAGRVGWPMMAAIARFSFALAASVAVTVWHMNLEAAFAIVSAGIIVAAMISVWGFRRARWGT